MKYKIISKIFKAPNGAERVFSYRENTNDYNTIVGAFCEDEYKILDLEFKKDDILLDLGAHIGSVTLLMTTLRPDLKIFAYEPFPSNFDLLKKNLEENGYSGELNIFKQAVWFYDDDDCKMYYGDSSKDGRIHRNIGTLFPVRDFYRKDLYKKVNATNLSAIFEENRIRDCAFMKIDVEGSEYGIFKAAPKEVLEMIRRIHGEYHPFGIVPPDNPRQLLLNQCKGVYKDITPRGPVGTVGPFVFIRK